MFSCLVVVFGCAGYSLYACWLDIYNYSGLFTGG